MLALEKIMTELKANSVNEVVGCGNCYQKGSFEKDIAKENKPQKVVTNKVDFL
jgi:hypothetical protein